MDDSHITHQGMIDNLATRLSNNTSDEVIRVLLCLAGLNCHLAVQTRPCIRQWLADMHLRGQAEVLRLLMVGKIAV